MVVARHVLQCRFDAAPVWQPLRALEMNLDSPLDCSCHEVIKKMQNRCDKVRMVRGQEKAGVTLSAPVALETLEMSEREPNSVPSGALSLSSDCSGSCSVPV